MGQAAAIVEYVTEEEAVTVVNAVKGRLISGRPVTASAVPPGTFTVTARALLTWLPEHVASVKLLEHG